MNLYRNSICLLIVNLAIASLSVGHAQQANQTARTVEVTSKMPYWLFLPSGYESNGDRKWPLMMFLHGAGERGENLELVKKWGPPKLVKDRPDFPFVLISPQCREKAYWNTAHLKQLLDQVIATHNVDIDRVYLTGLSMGGYGTWKLASEHPDMFAAIAPICGGGDPGSAVKLVDLPIWAFHGDADKVVPLSQTTQMVDAIKAENGNRVKLTVYEGVNHNSWTETYANPELYEWLLTQRRNR